MKKSNTHMKQIILVTLITFSLISCGDAYNNAVASEMDKIEVQVAEESIKSYNIAIRNNLYMDAYVQASIVSASYLSANDEENYLKWKQIQDNLASKIGL